MYTLYHEQFIPAGIAEVWDFMSSPANLKKITPAYMGFDIKTKKLAAKMYPGMIIEYRVAPLFGIKMTWVTEITHVIDQSYFVDEQRIGPYTLWHHQHHLKAVDGGVVMEDIVSYQLPLGILGRIMHGLLVKRQLQAIFAFRTQQVEAYFKPR